MAKTSFVKTYQWNSPSLVAQMDVRVQDKGNAVAYIYASENASEQYSRLHELREIFKQKGWASSSDTRNGKPVLRLTGIKDANELVNILQEGGYAQGVPAISSNDSGKSESRNAMDAIKNNSLKGAGIFYTIGNALYIISGIARNKASGKKDWGQIATGIAFSSSDLLIALFGDKDDKRQFKSLLKKLKNHLEDDGIEIPSGSALNAETRSGKGRLLEKAHDFIHEHISAIKALAEVAGGVSYFKAGIDQKNPWKRATAVIFSLGFGSTLFIKEKKPDPEKLKTAGPLEKAWAFVQEKPLRIGGWSGLSNTLFTTIGAFKERKKDPSSNFYKYDLATASSMLVGNNLYALSNKTTGGSITEGDLIKDVYGLAAQVLNHVPEDKREAAIQTTVNFLGERVEFKDSREKINTLLREEINRSRYENPWFKANTTESTQEALPPQVITAETPAKTFAINDKKYSNLTSAAQTSFVSKASEKKPLTLAV